MNTYYTIKTQAFEGPLHLLLNLVEERKLFINEVSLASVTEEYLKYISEAGNLNPEETSSFIAVAATLILIKSKSLLPALDLTREEKDDIRSLEERLRLYEIFRGQSEKIKKNFGKSVLYAPLERKSDVLVFLPDERITRESMMTFAREALGRIPQKVFLPEVEVKKVITIEEMIDRMTDRIKTSLKMNFRDFAGRGASRAEKVEVIVGFLAMLELVRQGILDAVQEENSDEITIEHLTQENS